MSDSLISANREEDVLEADIDGIPLVPKPSRIRLSERQALDYAHHRRSMIEWLLECGKNPSKGEGYSHSTIEIRASRIDQFHRFVWEDMGGFTKRCTHDYADIYLDEISQSPQAQSSKAHIRNPPDAIEGIRYFFCERKHVLFEGMAGVAVRTVNPYCSHISPS